MGVTCFFTNYFSSKLILVRRLRGRKRTIFTGSSPFNMTIHIRYGGISEINPDSRKFKIS